ncbi:MAG: SRPBCC domain-containing protein [Chloroflexota bacterium]|nr:SRPBCC domain-containing protein [Chloroflexota bacterium]
MTFQPDPHALRWRVHLISPPGQVHAVLMTDLGRAHFWAESVWEEDGLITWVFPGGQTWRGEVLENVPPRRFAVRYVGGSVATFDLADDGSGGTDLTLTDAGVPAEHRAEVAAGWVSVLLGLKAAVDFGIDLRNHDPARTWAQGYVDN